MGRRGRGYLGNRARRVFEADVDRATARPRSPADFVAIKTRMKAGKVIVTPRFGGGRALEDHHSLYYVHPRTGLLRKNEHYQRSGRQVARGAPQS